MADWWQWSPQKEEEVLTFAVVRIGYPKADLYV